MKKIFGIISAAVLLASGLLFTSCGDEEVTEVLAGPKNTWCRMPVSYKNSDSDTTPTEANLYAYFYYTDSNKTIGSTTFPAGLNIVVTYANSSSSSIISGLTENTFIMKTFAKNGTTSVNDDGDSGSTITVSNARAKWAAIYWGKDELRESSNKSTSAPSAVQNGTNISEGLDFTNFSWKRLLANYLLSVLE